VLKGDDRHRVLVITRTDEFSVIVERNGWRTETLMSSGALGAWVIGENHLCAARGKRFSAMPVRSTTRPSIGVWVNVGSARRFTTKVARVHERAAILAVIAAALSLLVSFGQARRL